MRFDEHYKPDLPVQTAVTTTQGISDEIEAGAHGIRNFLKIHSSQTFANGLYRIMKLEEMTTWTTIASDAFPEFRGHILCFSSDWLGRIFAVNQTRKVAGQYQILMLELGTGMALDIPVTFEDFHNAELVDFANEALAAQFYRDWLKHGGAPPGFGECVGYKTPLFLGGKDVIENLEVIDMHVYWTLTAQLLTKTRSLPDGTKISEIRLAD
ncbi:MAG: hypothetical protein RLZZ436_215 [Planctomycetota bacterium]|jgi:hypothetical protein